MARILIGCEFSGRVRDAFIKAGHDAISCDLEPPLSPGPHYQGSVLDILDDGWDLAVFHPPCTYLSVAGAKHLYKEGVIINQERLEKGIEAKAFFLKLLNAPIPRLCVENPRQFKIFEIPPHTQSIQPYEFGDPYSKLTNLWLKNLPLLIPTTICKQWENTSTAKWFNTGRAGLSQKRCRSITFQGIADAMAEQWEKLL